MMKRAAVHKLEIYPATVVIVDNPEALAKWCKKTGLDPVDPSGGYACCISVWSKQGFFAVLCFPEDMQDDVGVCPASTIAHECIHAVQAIFDQIGESSPGREAEAYLLDTIVAYAMKDLGYVVIKKPVVEKQQMGFHTE